MKYHFSSHIRILALSLLLIVAAGATAATTETFTIKPYMTAVAGTAGFNNEGYTNLTDGKTGTKWCANYSSGCYVTFKAASSVAISQYTLTTGNDTQGSGRNPTAWTLYGSTDNSNWTTIDTQTAAALPNANKTAKTFKLSTASSSYTYFKIVFTGITSGSIIQLSEISFNNFDYSDINNLWKYVDDGKVTSSITTAMSKTPTSTHTAGSSTWTFKTTAAGSRTRWSSAINIKTSLSAKSGVEYNFAIMLKSSANIALTSTAIRLADANDANNYLFNSQATNGNSMAPRMLADSSYVYIVNGAKLAKSADVNGNLMLTIDVRNVTRGTTITVEKVLLTTDLSYTFEHYVGDVYGKMTGTRPSDLNYSTDYKTHADDARINEGVTLQRAHEYNRDVYVFPGKTFELLPFSDYKTAGNYYETYGRWFDYTTDKKSSRLDFGSQTVCVADEGVFGCNVLTPSRKNGSYANYTAPSSSPSDGIMDVLAIDVSMSFNESNVTLGSNGVSKHITEPTLQFRNKFYIHDAKKRADEMTASADANEKYVDEHKMTLMCPANVPFQYPLPSYERWDFPNSAPMDYWYKKANTGTDDNDYAQVYHYLIKMYKKNSNGIYDFYGQTINLGHDIGGDSIPVNCKTLALAYKSSSYVCHELYIAQPQEGKYKIELIAIENSLKSGADKPAVASSGLAGTTTDYFTVINAYGSNEPLVLAEYELEVLPVSKGNMVDEKTLMNDDTYKFQRPDVMNELYGQPTTVVNFDDIDEADTEAAGGTHGSGRYYKWPWKWENSSYGFGYTDRYDYNQYVVFNNTWIVDSYNAASWNNDHYDRLYYDTNGEKQGYMFFANAAGEPGRMALLDIGNEFCTGTRVYVSAWLMESSKAVETANVVFSFRGVKADGTEVTLNNFASGYVTGGNNTTVGYQSYVKSATKNPDWRGKWMHIYWEFETDVTSENYDHFIIVLENNAANSSGADYAIDDIRAYVRRPIIYAQQETPVCNGSFSTPLKMYGNFEQLVESFGLTEATTEATDVAHDFYYVLLDKDTYNTEMETRAKNAGYESASAWNTAANSSSTVKAAYWEAYEAAFDSALVKGTYGGAKDDTYGMLTIHTYYESNDSIDGSDVTDGFRKVYFNVNATDQKMKVSKTYYVAMLEKDALATGEVPDATTFKICETCSKVSEFEVIFSGQVKIDGVLDSEMDGESYCANQLPVINIDLKGIEDGEVQTYNGANGEVYYDWFMGPYTPDAYYNQKSASAYGYIDAECYLTATKGSVSLFEAQQAFRGVYPTATTAELVNGQLSDGTAISPSGALTQDMIDYLKELAVEGKMYFYESNKTMSTMDQYNDENPKLVIYTTAIPLKPATAGENTKFCLDPIQVAIGISNRTPRMKDGDDSGAIKYPSSLNNVPLRIGLAQLKRCVMDNLSATTSTHDLYIPLRDLASLTSGVDMFGVNQWKKNKAEVTTTTDDYIYLAASNDPNVAGGKSGAVEVANSDLKCIGKLRSITAALGSTGNICHLAFIKDFKFREGYWYKVKFHFQEVYSSTVTDAHDDVCPGDVVFTIKVVPEYEMWTGAVSRNWNDDANWKRVSSTDLLASATDNDLKDYITDSNDAAGNKVNDTTTGYVPADFTKVIIPADATRMPYMYNMRSADNLQEVNFTGAKSASNYIKSTRPATGYEAQIGYATDLIKYDMASTIANDDADNVACRAWYDHTCEQIHFNSGAEIMQQQYLNYDKAWCDLEVEAGKWHTISSPLQQVVAGDLYLPTNGARQNTQLFKNINYDTTLNDRFAPAVYQRSWNKGTATVYKLDGSQDNSGIQLDWSHVYNDVQVSYDAGVGFSIKVDVSEATNAPADNIVKFRLPKADKQYTYYNPGNADGDKTTQTVSTADRTGLLTDLSADFTQTSGSTDGANTQYYLVGNPLMCYLDMAKFFETNTQFDKKYWLEQRTAVMTESGDEFISTDDIEGNTNNAQYVAAGQSFFVKLKDTEAATNTVSPVFTADMMAYAIGETDQQGQDIDISSVDVDANDPNPTNETVTKQNAESSVSSKTKGKRAAAALTAATQSMPMLRIIAATNDGRRSTAVLTDGATTQHAGGEMLMDSNLASDNSIFVYAAVKGQAMSIGSVSKGDTIPVAVIGNAEKKAITITGAEDFDYPIYLVDAETGESTQLLGATTLDVTESGVRYYLATESTAIDAASPAVPRLKVEGCTITAYAPAEAPIARMSVYSTDGIVCDSASDIADSHSVTLAPGVYLVELSTATWHHVYKLLLK